MPKYDFDGPTPVNLEAEIPFGFSNLVYQLLSTVVNANRALEVDA